jgi:alpha-beta hydrolase superfamily lysophospholipase
MGRYDQAARFLNERGILVCGEDHLGHGKTVSDEKYGYFAKRDGWSLVTRDVRRLRQLQGEKYPGTPYFLLGHSMGSFLVRTFLCRYPGQVDGAILSGTGQESASLVALGKALAVLVGLVKGEDRPSAWIEQLSLGAYNKKFKPNRTTADWISRDEGAVDEYLADPLCSFRPTPGMFRDMMGGLQEIASPHALARMDPNTPILFLSGDHDPVGGMGKGVKKVYGYFEAHGVRDLTLKLYPGGRHEMFHEVNRQEVLEDLAAWVEKHC